MSVKDLEERSVIDLIWTELEKKDLFLPDTKMRPMLLKKLRRMLDAGEKKQPPPH
jgi:hypothetical protein